MQLDCMATWQIHRRYRIIRPNLHGNHNYQYMTFLLVAYTKILCYTNIHLDK